MMTNASHRGSYLSKFAPADSLADDDDLANDADDEEDGSDPEESPHARRRYHCSHEVPYRLPKGYVLPARANSQVGPFHVPGVLRMVQVDAHRNLDCAAYNACLSDAQTWKGFSCAPCKRFRIRPEAEPDRFSRREVPETV